MGFSLDVAGGTSEALFVSDNAGPSGTTTASPELTFTSWEQASSPVHRPRVPLDHGWLGSIVSTRVRRALTRRRIGKPATPAPRARPPTRDDCGK